MSDSTRGNLFALFVFSLPGVFVLWFALQFEAHARAKNAADLRVAIATERLADAAEKRNK